MWARSSVRIASFPVAPMIFRQCWDTKVWMKRSLTTGVPSTSIPSVMNMSRVKWWVISSLIDKVRIGVEEMFCVFKQMVSQGTRNDDLCLVELKIDVSIFLENGCHHGNAFESRDTRLVYITFFFVYCCLLWIDKPKPNDKTYKWVSVRWKTKN